MCVRNKEKKGRLCNWHVLWLTIWYGGWDGVLSAGIAAADSPHHVSAITMGTNKAVPGPFPDQTLQLLQEWQSHTIHRVKEEPKTMKGSQNVWVKPSGHLNFKHWWFNDGIKWVFINRGQTSWPDHFESLQCNYLTFTETLKHWCLCFYFSSMRFNPKECWKPFERHQTNSHTQTHLLSQEEVIYMPTVEVPEYNQTSAVTNEDFIRVVWMFLQGLHRPQWFPTLVLLWNAENGNNQTCEWHYK